MNLPVKTQLLQHFKATNAVELEIIQSLWSGYGTISRWQLFGAEIETVVVKQIQLPEKTIHPRGWNTEISHQRKLKSYKVEMAWYSSYGKQVKQSCKIPLCYFTSKVGEASLLVLEDLDAVGYEERRTDLDVRGVKLCLKWLASFHGQFMNQKPTDLWNEGSYWHLETRPDELVAMEEGWLKDNARRLAEQLKSCEYQTLIHGDAKVANFCFAQNMKAVAAVDFQYVGGGCGMKDVIYLLGSCLTEEECETHEVELLDFYFEELSLATDLKDFHALEKEWRRMYSIAWSDFTRFLLGWMPTHKKVNGYSLEMVNQAMVAL